MSVVQRFRELLADQNYAGAWELGPQALSEESDLLAIAKIHHDLCLSGNLTARPAEALLHGKRALELYEQIGAPADLLLRLHIDLGGSHLRLGDYYSAVFRYNAGLQLSDSLTPDADLAKLHLGLGAAYNRLGNHALAVDQYHSALGHTKGTKLEVFTLVYVTEVYLLMGRAGDARQAWRSLQETSRQHQGYLHFHVLLYDARLRLCEGDIAGADRVIDQAMELCVANEHRRLALAHLVRAQVFAAMQKLRHAKECAIQATEYASKSPGNADVADQAAILLRSLEGGDFIETSPCDGAY